MCREGADLALWESWELITVGLFMAVWLLFIYLADDK